MVQVCYSIEGHCHLQEQVEYCHHCSVLAVSYSIFYDCWSIIPFVSIQPHIHSSLYSSSRNPSSANMKSTTFTLFSLSALSQVAFAEYGWHFGNAFSTGPVATNSFIRESNTTLVLPKVNSPQTGNLALWPGMGTSGGDLIQALAISVADGSAGCPKASGTWCVVASTLEGSQQMGGAVAANAGAEVTMHCMIGLSAVVGGSWTDLAQTSTTTRPRSTIKPSPSMGRLSPSSRPVSQVPPSHILFRFPSSIYRPARSHSYRQRRRPRLGYSRRMPVRCLRHCPGAQVHQHQDHHGQGRPKLHQDQGCNWRYWQFGDCRWWQDMDLRYHLYQL